MVSRQRKSQLKRKSMGLCPRCSSSEITGGIRCFECVIKHRKQERKRLGCKEYKPGNRGRPPKIK